MKTKEFQDLLLNGGYHHHYQRSFYATEWGQRIVIYPDKKLYVSSEAFGTESHIGHISAGTFHYNEGNQNEMRGASSHLMSREIGVEQNQYSTLSVSFKKTLYI